jgi:hypothetical protein
MFELRHGNSKFLNKRNQDFIQMEKEVENLKFDNKKLKNEIISVKSKQNVSENDTKNVDENLKLQKENQRLKDQIDSFKNEKEELYRLRELFFNLDRPIQEVLSTENLNDYEIVVIGGCPSLGKKLENENILCLYDEKDVRLDRLNVDYVFFYTQQISHSVYNKAIDYCKRNNIKYDYIQQKNIDYIKSQMSNFIRENIS